jgi:hypothetical protein
MENYENGKQYIVIALTVSAGDKHEGCRVLEEGSIYPAIYSQFYGPASREECEKWVAENCGGEKTSTMTEVYEVCSADLVIYRTHPPSLGITAHGKVRTTGWTDGKLSEWIYVKPPADGIYDFTFYATPPTGGSGDAITKIDSDPFYLKEIPEGMKGVRIHAETNEIEVMLDQAEERESRGK